MKNVKMLGTAVVCGALGALAGRAWEQDATAQAPSKRQPIALSVTTTEGGNYLMYRMWSDGLVDVRLFNPLIAQAHEWPESDLPGISFQERWKVIQYGD